MMHFGRHISKLGRTFLSPQKITSLSSRLSYQFACTSFPIQKRFSHYQKSQILSLKESSLTSPRRKENGSSMTRLLLMSKLIKSLSRSKVQPQESSLNYMLPQVIPYLSENLSLGLTLMPKSLKELPSLPKKKRNPNLLSHQLQHKPKLSRHPRRRLPKRLLKPISQNQLLLPLPHQYSQERGSRLVNPCQG